MRALPPVGDVGLMVPVVRHAEARVRGQCRGNRAFGQRRAHWYNCDELSGSINTLTSLGLGRHRRQRTPVLNLPVAGVNRIVERRW